MAGYPIPDTATWDGVTGREWTAHGTGLVRYEYRAGWTVEYATRNPGVGWNAFTDYSAYLMGFHVHRKVDDWYLGPAADNGTLSFDDSDGAHRCPAGGRLRLSVTVPSGTFVLFDGMVIDQMYELTAGVFPTVSVIVTNWFGYEARTTTSRTSDTTETTGEALARTIDSGSWGPRDLTRWDDGVTQMIPEGVYNVPDQLSRLVRGDLGMLWVTREGEWAYRAKSWWNDDRVTAAAAIGDSGPPDAYDYLFPLESTVPVTSLNDTINEATWFTPSATLDSITEWDSDSFLAIHQRSYSDTVWDAADTDAEDGVWRLVNLYATPAQRISSVTYPADLSSDAMEYSARAEITDFVNVAMESLEGYWSEWLRCHVLGVRHDWNPHTGWTVTLDVITGLYEDWESWILDTSTLGVETIPG